MEWIVKEKSYSKSQYDSEVMISKTFTRKKDSQVICFRFRKNSFFKIIKEKPFVMVAKDGQKIYFKESDSRNGFKLREIGVGQRYLRIPESKKFEVSDEECGEFNLKFDSELGLCFIDTRFKLEKELNWKGTK